MPISTPAAPRPAESAEDLAGAFAPLTLALGASEALASLQALAGLLRTARPESPAALADFLACYRDRLLGPVELPAIRAAYEHAIRGEARELIQLDQCLGARFGGQDSAFTAASRHVGRTQLRRLRPIADRTLQRYLLALDEGRAVGWHVIAYGLLLALFSLPLRQGLSHYAARTQSGLLESASGHLALPAAVRSDLQALCDAPLPALDQTVRPGFTPRVV